MAVQVNTAVVLDTSNQVAKTNQSIKDDFSEVESAIKNLSNEWVGSASEVGIGKMDYLKRSFCERRYNVVNDMVLFMQNQVREGYETTEKTISSAASAFK